MEYRSLGNSSLRASVLGIGALHFGVYSNQEDATRIINRALDIGINFIDTAPMYGNGYSETIIGKAIKGKRKDVIISTKVGLEPKSDANGSFGIRIGRLKEKYIRENVEKSLKSLKTDYLDLYSVHVYDPETPLEETMHAMHMLIKGGKVRYIGCSNYSHDELKESIVVADKSRFEKFATFQNHYNLIERGSEKDIIPTCYSHGVSIICNQALARGILTGKYKINKPIPKESRAVHSQGIKSSLTKNIMILVEVLEKYSREHGRSVAELAIAWLLAKPGVSVVLAGMRNISQLEECSQGTGWVLSEYDIREIDIIINKYKMTQYVKNEPKSNFEIR